MLRNMLHTTAVMADFVDVALMGSLYLSSQCTPTFGGVMHDMQWCDV